MHDISGSGSPLDGTHIFDAGAFWHFIGLGFTELYAKQSDRADVSGLGYEFTFRLAKHASEPIPPTWPIDLMNGLGRPAMRGELEYGAGHTVKTGPLAADGDGARYVGVIVTNDPELVAIDTPNGRVAFLQLVLVEHDQLVRAQHGNAAVVLAEIADHNPRFVARVEP
jgi:hypothetical protein